jgi:hypothetical protein
MVLPDVAKRVGAWHRPLVAFTGLMLVTAVVAVGGLLFDDRVVTGEPIWLKPFKFAVSLAVYSLTWAWLLSRQSRRSRVLWWSGTAVSVLLTLEMAIIVGQVVRGRASHFNAATPLDSTLYNLMGATITIAWVLGMLQGLLLLRDRTPDRALVWAVRLGILIGSVGIGLAFLMLEPTGDQLQAMQHGGAADRVGAHSVGVVDGGPGMPLTGWSTTGGDLRIPHFVGIHALQALPLLAMLLTVAARRVPRLADARVRVHLVLVAAGAYAAFTGLVTWQALRGQSLVDPDLWTLGAFGVLVVATGLGVRAALAAVPVPGLEPSR